MEATTEPDRHEVEMMKILNPMAKEEFEKDYEPEPEDTSPIKVLQKNR